MQGIVEIKVWPKLKYIPCQNNENVVSTINVHWQECMNLHTDLQIRKIFLPVRIIRNWIQNYTKNTYIYMNYIAYIFIGLNYMYK